MKDLLKEFPESLMTAQEEADLARRGGEDAMNELVIANMRRALLYTQTVDRGKIDLQTLVSLCYQELSMSAPRFDPRFKKRFFAFAKAGLRGRLYRHWNSKDVVRNQTEQISLDALAQPSNTEVLTAKGSAASKIQQTMEDDPNLTEELRSSTRELTTGEVASFGFEQVMNRDQWAAIRKRLDGVLSEHEWMIIDLTYKGQLNFREIGVLLGISRSRVSRYHVLALRRLRCAVRLDEKLLNV